MDLALSISGKCNNKCVHCFLNDKNAKKIENFLAYQEKLEDIIKIYSKYKNVKSIILSGKEPTLNKNLFKILRYFKNKCVRVIIKTNGRALSNKRFCRRILAFVDLVDVSILSTDPSVHNKITRANSYHETFGGIANLVWLSKSKKISVTMVPNSLNLSSMQKTVKDLLGIGVRKFNFNFLYSSNSKLNVSIARLKEKIVPLIEEIKKQGGSVKSYAFPLCALGKYWRINTDSPARIISPQAFIEDEDILRAGARKKLKICDNCRLSEKCGGFWDAYADVCGDCL